MYMLGAKRGLGQSMDGTACNNPWIVSSFLGSHRPKGAKRGFRQSMDRTDIYILCVPLPLYADKQRQMKLHVLLVLVCNVR